ncbi:ADP-ribosylglycohydrolase family protein [Nostoc sp. CENA67]|uniref:ADP-ribosylglycohydrolase family protein n=1 Tax=Amazonocrinis nigriterrae CENA67 TaxID=2794033 RepID=A0A8J7HW38_9NOST|nr:ADP-ribosylglycohydrolase family protein [Amazonocrinis nigriterrae]MBH8567088.1 ADP-ribosylglycohydrolase family protein [Amazonocrinis nigriterrae CENA67]
MRYSLVSRFRGTILGVLLGQTLAKDYEQKSQNCFEMVKIAILGTQSLISLGKLDLDDWLKRQQQRSFDLHINNKVSLQAILATIPVALFFHENKIKLRENLLRVLQIWEYDPVVRDGTLAVGYAIAKSLTEKLQPRTLIPQIIAFLGETSTSIPQNLLKVNDLLEQGVGLEKAQAEFSKQEKWSNAIAMAFYCFLSTLEDFPLAVLRATDNGNVARLEARNSHLQIIGAITGALSGAYNSTVGIPVKWQILLSSGNLTAWELTSLDQMLELADALVAVWSGVYSVALHPSESQEQGCVMSNEQALLCVYAAPHVIRSR